MKNSRKLPILLLFLFSACTHREGYPPETVLPPGRFASAYIGLMKVGVQTSAGQFDSLVQSQQVDSLFQQLGITRKLFKSSVSWYNRDPIRWRAVMDSATKMLDEEQTHPR